MSLRTFVISWEEVRISTLTGVWKKLILSLVNDLEEFKPLVEEGVADVVEIARQLEFKVEPEELLRSHDETNEGLLLMDK